MSKAKQTTINPVDKPTLTKEQIEEIVASKVNSVLEAEVPKIIQGVKEALPFALKEVILKMQEAQQPANSSASPAEVLPSGAASGSGIDGGFTQQPQKAVAPQISEQGLQLISGLMQLVSPPKPSQQLIPLEAQQQLMTSLLAQALSPKSPDFTAKDIIEAEQNGMKNMLSMLQLLTRKGSNNIFEQPTTGEQ